MFKLDFLYWTFIDTCGEKHARYSDETLSMLAWLHFHKSIKLKVDTVVNVKIITFLLFLLLQSVLFIYVRSHHVSKIRSASRCAASLCLLYMHALPDVFIRRSKAVCICAFTQHLERVLSQQSDRVTGPEKWVSHALSRHHGCMDGWMVIRRKLEVDAGC